LLEASITGVAIAVRHSRQEAFLIALNRSIRSAKLGSVPAGTLGGLDSRAVICALSRVAGRPPQRAGGHRGFCTQPTRLGSPRWHIRSTGLPSRGAGRHHVSLSLRAGRLTNV